MDSEIIASMMEQVVDEWGDYLPVEQWPTQLLVDLEILVNGELQRRAPG